MPPVDAMLSDRLTIVCLGKLARPIICSPTAGNNSQKVEQRLVNVAHSLSRRTKHENVPNSRWRTLLRIHLANPSIPLQVAQSRAPTSSPPIPSSTASRTSTAWRPDPCQKQDRRHIGRTQTSATQQQTASAVKAIATTCYNTHL